MSAGDKKSPESFGDLVGGVRRLPPSRRIAPPVDSRAPSRTAPDGPQRAPVVDLPFHYEDDGVTISGARIGLERHLRDLARSRVTLGDRIDMHGMTLEQAERELLAFVRQSRGSVRRAVLVVHGKGKHSKGGRGILRDEIAKMLSSRPLVEHVLCFTSARPEDGGSGALYVLLAARR